MSADQESPYDDQVSAFWEVAKRRAKLASLPGYFGPSALESLIPPAWSFGATPEQSDALLELVLAGSKTATSSALWDYETTGEPLPERGSLGILVDGAGRPRALVVTTEVQVVRFDEVDAEHARLEGEGDLSLEHWRKVHERFFTEHAEHDRGFSPDMPIVLERFEVIYED
ncbi:MULTISPECIES: ASCH domain-containing protein [Nocardioides]|uniref:ASCH domain-containing protein n=1 Tax=Nocardioides vastitatis TaxID=2568655 RepID=A0ABW0ZIJ0_9ACTN|nr:ASCH domain-containing protein [Nocardioides sp.]THI98562.1 ASCH domain-containing protein [Nocardioides sp.]